jgi:Pyruvate/2-oxoacid:ferredoxin oxidoreductase gamma subunit
MNYFRRIGISNIYSFDATGVAIDKGGGLITMSMVMLGAAFATGLIPLKMEAVESCIIAFAPKKWTEANVNSFRAGVAKFRELVHT